MEDTNSQMIKMISYIFFKQILILIEYGPEIN